MSKAAFVLMSFCLVFFFEVHGQVSIGVPTAHPSALLELNTQNKGFLLPRLSTAQREAIIAPAAGLMVFDTNLGSLFFYTGTSWQQAGGSYWGSSGGVNIINTNLGRVGIGVSNPLAQLAVDSGIVVDQSSSNDPLIAGRNHGLFFGGDGRVGITSSRQNGSGLRSGLSFFTNGARRMIIDSLGRIGIGITPDPNYQLILSGSLANMYISGGLNVFSILNRGDMVIDDRLAINSDGIGSAALRIKGRTGTPDSWGQHIMLVNATTSDSAAILYDADGMKLRTFTSGDAFFFRNNNNSTSLSINSEGNVAARGEITSLNRGVVLGHDINSHQIRYFTSSFAEGFSFNLNSGGGAPLGVLFNFGFSAAPFAFGAMLTGCNVIGGDIDKVVLNLRATTTSQANFEIINVGNSNINCSGCQIKFALVGPR